MGIDEYGNNPGNYIQNEDQRKTMLQRLENISLQTRGDYSEPALLRELQKVYIYKAYEAYSGVIIDADGKTNSYAMQSSVNNKPMFSAYLTEGLALNANADIGGVQTMSGMAEGLIQCH
jgi:hypothetical protein